MGRLDRIKALLQKKVFGVKVLYIVAVFVVALLIFALRMKTSPEATEPETEEPEGDIGGEEPEGDTGTKTPSYPDTDGTGTVTPTPTTPDTTDPTYPTPAEPETNESWGRKAIDWLIKNGATVDQATTAIQKYLNGDQLSYSEGLLRNKAVAQFGLPPDIPTSGGTLPKPAPKPAGPKKAPRLPAVHHVQGKSDNTYGELAKLYYGSSADKYIDLIQAHNLNRGHAAPSGGWKVGTTIYIPAKREPAYFKATRTTRTSAAIAKKNGISTGALKELNDKTKFPVKIGTRVRVK